MVYLGILSKAARFLGGKKIFNMNCVFCTGCDRNICVFCTGVIEIFVCFVQSLIEIFVCSVQV